MVKESSVMSKLIQEKPEVQGNCVPLAQADAAEENPYSDVIGAFENDPMLDAMMANIRARRREIDADDTIA